MMNGRRVRRIIKVKEMEGELMRLIGMKSRKTKTKYEKKNNNEQYKKSA